MSLKFPKLKAANCIVAFLSSALQAFGMYNIHALSGVTEGGVLGATLLFDHWFGLSPAVSSFVLNIACYALGWKTLGKSFIAYSAIAACGYSASYAVCELFPPLWPEIANLPLLASADLHSRAAHRLFPADGCSVGAADRSDTADQTPPGA